MQAIGHEIGLVTGQPETRGVEEASVRLGQPGRPEASGRVLAR